MEMALILADHEDLYEFSRMSRAVLLALVLGVLAIVAYRWARPGPLAVAGLAAAALTIGLGLIPRETSSGYIICGPPLNLPDSVPAFTNAGTQWADSTHCDDVMAAPMWWLAIGIAASAALFVAARRSSAGRGRVEVSSSGGP